jgi:hypothetical protein
MNKIYLVVISLFVALSINAQTTLDLSTVDAAFKKTVEGDVVIDVATTSSKIAAPKLSFENPFKGKEFIEAQISFDVYNYGELKVLGALLSIYDATLGRMYFTNGSYLGYNAPGGWFDANMVNYGIGVDFLGANVWKNVKLQFSIDGFALLVDDKLAFNEKSTDITIGKDANTPFSDYTKVISFLQEASIFVIGTGSWWSDNTRDDGSYWDPQNSYLKNIKFTPNFSSVGKQTIKNNNGIIIREEFFSISGQNAGTDYNALKPGVYIKRAVFSNGTIQSAKMVKAK